MKRIIAFLLCILLFSSFTVAYAAGGSALHILGYEKQQDTLDVFLYAKDDTPFFEKDFSVRYGNNDLPVVGLNALSRTEYGTSWIVILEPASSSALANTVTELLEELFDSMGAEDNLAIIDAVSRGSSAFVQDMKAIRGPVSAALSPSSAGANVRLYDAINSAYEMMENSANVKARKCLLIISRCIDSGSSYTFKNVLKQAENSPATIYTLGLNSGYYDEAHGFEEIQELSDSAPGGYAFSINAYDKVNGYDLANELLDNEKACFVLTADISGLSGTQTETLRVSLNKREAVSEDVKIEMAELPENCTHEWGDDATCQHARTCKKCGIEDPEGEKLPCQDDGTGHCKWCGKELRTGDKFLEWVRQNTILVIMIAVLLLLLIVLLIILVRRKNSPTGNTSTGMDEGGEVYVRTTPALSVVTVELTNKETGERFSGEIFDSSIIAGLEGELRLAGDSTISRKHMEFIWQNGILYVQDMNSTNGTFVNGHATTGAVQLSQNDVIRAGESDFYVTWRYNR